MKDGLVHFLHPFENFTFSTINYALNAETASYVEQGVKNWDGMTTCGQLTHFAKHTYPTGYEGDPTEDPVTCITCASVFPTTT